MACPRTYSVVLACDEEGGIGRKNAIPWQLREDMAFFRRLTRGHDPGVKNTVIMGRRTYESLPGGPLKHRNNIVVSSSQLGFTGAALADSLDSALSLARIFEEALKDPRCTRVYITRVEGKYSCDVCISLDLSSYELASSSEPALSSTGVRYRMEEWVRVNSNS